MNPAQLSATVVEALASLVDQGTLVLPDGVPTEVTVERPREASHGDYATNVAMKLAKKAGTNPRALGELLATELRSAAGIAQVDVAGPGFLNVTVAADAQGQVAADILAAGTSYGATASLAGERINLEFVSANPTGPLHIGAVRWAAVGDALGRVFEFCGAEVTREYYFNDHGGQIDRFSRSLLASALGEPAPEDGYGGQYIHDIAAAVVAAHPDAPGLAFEEANEAFRAAGVEMMFDEIKKSLHDFGVDFDVYFHEDNLHKSGAVDRAVARLGELGNTYEQDGALWLATERFGDDKDRVIIKSDGQGAYLSGDLAYYLDKRERGFGRCFIMLGADHHGYVQRLMAMCQAFGDTPHVNLEVLIGQMVNLLQDGAPMRMSKRAGTVVTIDDLVGAIGVDASRYALARYSSDSPIDLDLGLWTSASNENPVYYVQYAHARTCRMIANATDLAMALPGEGFDGSLLDHERDRALLRALADFPAVVSSAAELREPHRIARYLEDTASAFNKWYDTKECRMLPQGDEPVTPTNEARLVLVHATNTVLANGLGLLGVSAPERM
ncbi:arginine--tRNA ligase [Nocardioides sp.]|uniref:arginine--tRNA ligase n=1 Tax=Nocardioides sp. TaxID=35761 RepID=UPI002619B7B9|nr:arginine--tRNA ligase [Nocardioides sp.]